MSHRAELYEDDSLYSKSREAIMWKLGTLKLVGIGLNPEYDLTLGALNVLDTASLIFSPEPDFIYDTLPASVSAKITNLQYLFDQEALRDDALLIGARMAVEAASKGDGVAYMVAGHPTIASRPSTHIRQLAEEYKIQVDTTAAISSVDSLLADMLFDASETGLQVIRGNMLCELASTTPVVVLCPGYAEDVKRRSRLKAASALVEKLREAYGEDATFLCYSRLHDGVKWQRLTIRELLMLLCTAYRLAELLLFGPVELLPESVLNRLELD